MQRLLTTFSAVLLLIVISGFTANAQFLALDPRLQWQVLETENFNIIYHQGLERAAEETATLSEKAFDIWSQKLNYTPNFKLNIIVADLGDLGAGAANPLTRDTIQGVSTARSTNEWLNSRTVNALEAVVVHEIGHIFDLINKKSVPQFLSQIFGSIITPNLARPGTFIEGL